jgi:hypothetical protein
LKEALSALQIFLNENLNPDLTSQAEQLVTELLQATGIGAQPDADAEDDAGNVAKGGRFPTAMDISNVGMGLDSFRRRSQRVDTSWAEAEFQRRFPGSGPAPRRI